MLALELIVWPVRLGLTIIHNIYRLTSSLVRGLYCPYIQDHQKAISAATTLNNARMYNVVRSVPEHPTSIKGTIKGEWVSEIVWEVIFGTCNILLTFRLFLGNVPLLVADFQTRGDIWNVVSVFLLLILTARIFKVGRAGCCCIDSAHQFLSIAEQ